MKKPTIAQLQEAQLRSEYLQGLSTERLNERNAATAESNNLRNELRCKDDQLELLRHDFDYRDRCMLAYFMALNSPSVACDAEYMKAVLNRAARVEELLKAPPLVKC